MDRDNKIILNLEMNSDQTDNINNESIKNNLMLSNDDKTMPAGIILNDDSSNSRNSSSSSINNNENNHGYISSMDINLLLSNNNKDDTLTPINDLKQLEQDKKAVYSHPLFPLLALLFEKCETATRSINSFETDPSLSSFNEEIEEFIRHQNSLGKPFFTNDSEVDSLMIKAIQVFRIHLLELEKVSELCKDFCQRYISCLRTKMRSDALIRGNSENSNHVKNKLFHDYRDVSFFQREPSTFFGSTSSLSSSNMSSSNSSPVSYLSSPPPPSPSSSISSQKSNNTSNPSNTLDIDAVMYCSKSSSSPTLPPLSVNFDTIMNPSFFKSMSKCMVQHSMTNNLTDLNDHLTLNKNNKTSDDNDKDDDDDDNDDDDDDDDDDDGGNEMVHDLSLKNKITPNLSTPNNTNNDNLNECLMKLLNQNETTSTNINKKNDMKKEIGKCVGTNVLKNVPNKKTVVEKNTSSSHSKRGVLPKQATSIMRSWLFQHIVHPYPTEDEKRSIASETNLTLLQVNNWFINARRRILQPMLDSANNIQVNEQQQNQSNNIINNHDGRELDLSTKVLKTNGNLSSSIMKKFRSNSQQQQQQQMNRFWPQSLANIIQTNDSNSKL